VHPGFVALNRNSLVQMVMSNWFGLNAPAIAALESEYEEMWARDVAAMSGYYSEASAAVAQMAPVPTFTSVHQLQQFMTTGRPWSPLPLTGQSSHTSAASGANLGLGN
jgi:PPE-repeat protein